MGDKHHSQPQQALDDRHQFTPAKIKGEGDHGIALRYPDRPAEDRRLQGGGILPGPAMPEFDGIAGELEFRIDRDRADRQAIELRQQRLTVVDLLDQPDLLTQTRGVWPDWQSPGFGLAQ